MRRHIAAYGNSDNGQSGFLEATSIFGLPTASRIIVTKPSTSHPSVLVDNDKIVTFELVLQVVAHGYPSWSCPDDACCRRCLHCWTLPGNLFGWLSELRRLYILLSFECFQVRYPHVSIRISQWCDSPEVHFNLSAFPHSRYRATACFSASLIPK